MTLSFIFLFNSVVINDMRMCVSVCVCVCVPVCVLQGFFESVFSVWPVSWLFELNGSVHEWWFRWKLDRFVSEAVNTPTHPV